MGEVIADQRLATASDQTKTDNYIGCLSHVGSLFSVHIVMQVFPKCNRTEVVHCQRFNLFQQLFFFSFYGVQLLRNASKV